MEIDVSRVFDVSRVYTAVNAQEVKVGSKVYVAMQLAHLKYLVNKGEDVNTEVIKEIKNESVGSRFCIFSDNANSEICFPLCYLVEPPEEKKLKWTDLKIGDVIGKENLTYLITGIDCNGGIDEHNHIYANSVPVDDIWLETWEKVEK